MNITPPNRVLRGGYWGYYGAACRSAVRHGDEPGCHGSRIGFRPVLKPMTTTNKPPNRVLRGGSWNSSPTNLRCASRFSINPVFEFDVVIGFRSAGIGFRPVIKKTQQNDHH
jgi:formylglycine-generating enzyme required for sulfatase activity|tara:strand:+ start:540 stop:875 length:336 start_codon:yes stop_codon:yes gene_type:complete